MPRLFRGCGDVRASSIIAFSVLFDLFVAACEAFFGPDPALPPRELPTLLPRRGQGQVCCILEPNHPKQHAHCPVEISQEVVAIQPGYDGFYIIEVKV